MGAALAARSRVDEAGRRAALGGDRAAPRGVVVADGARRSMDLDH
ncbi:hypothetical protein [Sorangium sp. So ce513]